VIWNEEEINLVKTPFPVIVKPLHEGSSKGIFNNSVVNNADALRNEAVRVLTRYHGPVLIEEYLPGREFTVALLGNGNNLNVLPIVEINVRVIGKAHEDTGGSRVQVGARCAHKVPARDQMYYLRISSRSG
jgi:D-alanine-D-alanine ligase-like ATP-grasp enzyme